MMASVLTPETSTEVEVDMVYAWFTLLTGTPLILYGPVTARSPLLSCLSMTTLFPLNLPARRIRTLPGATLFLSFGAFGVCLFGVYLTLSAGYQSYFLTIFPLNNKNTLESAGMREERLKNGPLQKTPHFSRNNTYSFCFIYIIIRNLFCKPQK